MRDRAESARGKVKEASERAEEGKRSKTAYNRIKKLNTYKNMPKPPKAQYKQNTRLSRHSERESNTAKAQHKHENTPKTAYIQRSAINPYKHIAQQL